MGKVITIGELMIRLTPPNKERLQQATSFHSYYGGAEANVAVSLSMFGHDATFLSVLPDNELGTGAIKYLLSNGVHTDLVYRKGERIGLYYYEEGYSARQAKVIYDRNHASFLELPTIEINWEEVFKDVDILHITGITPALSKELKQFTLKAVKQASNFGVKISFDFNYRSKLWSIQEAKETFLSILPYVSICFAGYKDFVFLLGESGPEQFDAPTLKEFYHQYSEKYSIEYFVSTDREMLGGQKQRLAGYLYHKGIYYETSYFTVNILERIGGGDAFAAGILHAILTGMSEGTSIYFGVAAGVLKHTIYGDANQFTSDEVMQFLENKGNDVSR